MHTRHRSVLKRRDGNAESKSHDPPRELHPSFSHPSFFLPHFSLVTSPPRSSYLAVGYPSQPHHVRVSRTPRDLRLLVPFPFAEIPLNRHSPPAASPERTSSPSYPSPRPTPSPSPPASPRRSEAIPSGSSSRHRAMGIWLTATRKTWGISTATRGTSRSQPARSTSSSSRTCTRATLRCGGSWRSTRTTSIRLRQIPKPKAK